VSLDFPDAARHDAVRGEGAFGRATDGIDALKRAGVGFQVNMTVGRANAALLDEMLDLAEGLGAEAFHLFFVVDVGRAAQCRTSLALEDYEGTLERVAQIERRSAIEFKVTCAPQYERIRKEAGLSDEGRRVTRGCLAGCGFLFISAVGEVKPCGYFDHVLAHVGRRPLAEVWAANPVLAALRAFDSFKGGCGRCRNNRVCGGCRARALSMTGDFLNADPACPYNR
jgi:radical SAM protein with 4Fe4S-binding SPASM domain